jgi:tRNA(fMet)-specific endonuclease VapC
MRRYLLDTNAVSDLVHDAHGPVATTILRHGVDRICTSIIVAAELRFGAAKRGSARFVADLAAVLATLTIEPFDQPADRCYGELRAALERRGRPIGPNDMLIAAHALALGCTIVTADVDEFSRVKGLPVENWLR